MADIKEALKILWEAEHSNNKRKVLHINKGENGYTFMGIYQSAHPSLELWKIIRQKLQQYNNDAALVGEVLFDNPRVQELVENFYRREFWDKAKLDKVDSQNTANEIFIFGVNVGMIQAIKVMQKLIGVTADGIVGQMTLRALNAYNDTVFSYNFDEAEKEYYEALSKRRPDLAINIKGWLNRARIV